MHSNSGMPTEVIMRSGMVTIEHDPGGRCDRRARRSSIMNRLTVIETEIVIVAIFVIVPAPFSSR